jgi:hypothetical protein
MLDQAEEIVARAIFWIDLAVILDGVWAASVPFRATIPIGWIGMNQIASTPMLRIRGRSASHQ